MGWRTNACERWLGPKRARSKQHKMWPQVVFIKVIKNVLLFSWKTKKKSERRKYDEPSSPSAPAIAQKKTLRSAQNNNASDQRRAQRKKRERDVSIFLILFNLKTQILRHLHHESELASDCWLWLATVVKSHPQQNWWWNAIPSDECTCDDCKWNVRKHQP